MHSSLRRVSGRSAASVATLLALGLATASPALAADPNPSPRPLAGADSGSFPSAQVPLGDTDNRGSAVAPLAGAVAAVAGFGTVGRDIDASYTQYGTVATLVNYRGPLQSGLSGSAADVARGFVAAHAGLFGLSAGEVAGLEMWRDETLASTADSHAVLFRQHAGGLPMAEDGLISVAVKGDAVYGVTSSAVPSEAINATAPSLSAADAVLAVAHDDGVTGLALGDLVTGDTDTSGFTHVSSKKLPQTQYVRLRALPMTGGAAHLAYEVNFEDVAGTDATASVSYVDALSGAVLKRHDAVQTDADETGKVPTMRAIDTAQAAPGVQALPAAVTPTTGTFTGAYTPTSCSVPQPLTLDAGTTQVAVTASVAGTGNAADDIKVEVSDSGPNRSSQEYDNATSPEAGVYTFSPAYRSDSAHSGEQFFVSVCAYNSAQTGGTFAGSFAATSVVAPVTPPVPPVPTAPGAVASVNAPAKFSYFTYAPSLGLTTPTTPTNGDTRTVGCGPTVTGTTSVGKSGATCTEALQTQNLPNAYDTTNGVSTGQTAGNNAVETNAQDSTSLTAGAPGTTYQSPTRDYLPAYSDSWRSTQCNPVTIHTPAVGPASDPNAGNADIHATQTNLFIGHNRLHDFSYLLGLNDKTGSLQLTNATSDGTPGDPETGNVQNAADTDQALRDGGPVGTTTGVGLTGRNNANQITEADGVPGITNQYLFEPVVGFYGPCTDGGDDASVFLHEYTHAISNRLIAGPATGLSGQQGGSMGESWSDLDAIEFLNAFGYAQSSGADRYAEGPFVTGNNTLGIRDYNLQNNPLTYGELGFDSTGPEVHADGEIWNGVQMQIRQALIDYWKTQGSSDDNRALEVRCATATNADGSPRMINGVLDSFTGCPGDRRWITYVYDSLILQANGAPTFLNMRDTTIMSVLMRNAGGAASPDYKAVVDAFAKRGEGTDASSPNSTDTDPMPGFTSAITADNATVSFKVVDADTGAAVSGAKIYPGTFEARATPLVTTAADGTTAAKGFVANASTSAASQPASYTFVVQAPGYGLTRVGATTFTAGTSTIQTLKISRNLASVSSGATPVAATGQTRMNDAFDDTEATDSGIGGHAVLGDTYTVKLRGTQQVQVLGVGALNRPVVSGDSTDFQSRITNLRSFHVQASTDGGSTWKTVYTSPGDFFPASRPRPVAPEENYRTVTLDAPVTANALRLVVDTTHCTGEPTFSGPNLTPSDPQNNSSCAANTTLSQQVNVDEIEAFGPSAVGLNSPAGPAPALPESPVALLFPVAALAVVGGAVALRRRRRGAVALD